MKAKGTKGVSCVSWLSSLFVVTVLQSPPPICYGTLLVEKPGFLPSEQADRCF